MLIKEGTGGLAAYAATFKTWFLRLTGYWWTWITSGLLIGANSTMLDNLDYSRFYTVRCVGCVKEANEHRYEIMWLSYQRDGNEPNGIDNNKDETTEAPKSPITNRGVGPQLWWDMEQELIYPSPMRGKKSSNIVRRESHRGDEYKEVLRLNTIYNKSKSNPGYRFSKLYKIISREQILNLSFEHLKNRINVKESSYRANRIQLLRNALQCQRYRPKPGKSFEIKTLEGKSRRIKAPRFEDKIVQNIVRWTLQAIWEPKFRKHSFGFRPGLGPHDALYYIKQHFKSINFWFKGDFSTCFDNIDRHALQEKLKAHIKDQKFIDLYWKIVKVGYIGQFRTLQTSISGIPQGDIISPILINIYLNEFDRKMEELIKEVDKIKVKRKINPEWRKISYKISKAKKKGENIRPILSQRAAIPYFSTPRRKIVYVRYADDFLVGLTGPIDFCQEYASKIKKLIKEIKGLPLNKDKSFFCPARKYVKFLGILVSAGHPTSPKTMIRRKIVRIKRDSKTYRIAIPLNRDIIFRAPTVDIKNKLALFGYCYSGNNPRAKACLRLYPIDHPHIVSIVNSVFYGINNYYSFVDNRAKLIWIIRRILWNSVALLIKRKYKLLSLGQVVKKFGIGLNRGLCFQPLIIKFQNSFPNQPWKFIHGGSKKNLGVLPIIRAVRLRKWTLNSPCSICGSTIDVEVHHIKALRKKNIKIDPWTRLSGIVKRKQISLCRKCHLRVHRIN